MDSEQKGDEDGDVEIFEDPAGEAAEGPGQVEEPLELWSATSNWT